jgi:hypothetical protein
MMSFIPPKRKLFEIMMLPVFLGVFYLVYPNVDALILFSFGFIWNWSASNDLSLIFENKRYRMSMLKLVVNLQNLILKPFQWAPKIIQKLVQVLPAGIFWTLVIYLNESNMPWWATFLGSLVFELLQIELTFIRSQKEIS